MSKRFMAAISIDLITAHQELMKTRTLENRDEITRKRQAIERQIYIQVLGQYEDRDERVVPIGSKSCGE